LIDAKEIELNSEVGLLLVLSKGAATRKKILEKLLFKPRNCNQVAVELGLDWWTVQKHLELLAKEALVRSLNLGRMKFYKITRKGELALKFASSQ
jgi:predicted ArsR family transcriptional regulator